MAKWYKKIPPILRAVDTPGYYYVSADVVGKMPLSNNFSFGYLF